MQILLYILLSLISVYSSDLLLFALDKNELQPFIIWNKFLLKLKINNSKWASVLGACETCFSVWVGQIFLFTYYLTFAKISLFIIPLFFINLGLIGMSLAIKNILKK